MSNESHARVGGIGCWVRLKLECEGNALLAGAPDAPPVPPGEGEVLGEDAVVAFGRNGRRQALARVRDQLLGDRFLLRCLGTPNQQATVRLHPIAPLDQASSEL